MFAVMVASIAVGVQTARLETVTAEADYLRLRLHAELGLAQLRKEQIELYRTVHQAESAYIRTLRNGFELAALRSYVARTNPQAPAEEIATSIQSCARRHGVEPQLVLAVMQQESHFNPAAVGSSGERGLMQLMPGIAAMYGLEWNRAFSVEDNVCAGTSFLADLMERSGDFNHALRRYNGGGDALYSMRVARYLLRISREFPRSELAADVVETEGDEGAARTVSLSKGVY
jgi:soluble lytic murein transglycosylase-like protein